MDILKQLTAEELKELQQMIVAVGVKEAQEIIDGEIAEREKGGKGSGYRGHPGGMGGEGNPGGSRSRASMGLGGGAAPAKGFDVGKWTGMSIPDRNKKWDAMSVAERDKLADAPRRVPANQKSLISHAGARPELQGDDVQGAIDQRLQALVKDNGDWVVPEENAGMISDTVREMDGWLEKAGASPEARYQLGMEAADALVAQDREALGRTLGDHGIHHLRGNVTMANDIMGAHPSPDTAEQMSTIYLSQVFHDTGYLADPSRNFMDEGHPRWGAQHYNSNIQPLVKGALGSRVAGEVGHIIRTHDSTGIDWKGDTVATACRTADNLALFHREKLPPLLRNVPGNTQVMKDLAAKKIDASQAQRQMRANIQASRLSAPIKAQLTKSAGEVSPVSPKFMLGMLGGEVSSVEWEKQGGLGVHLKRSPEYDELHKVLDMGQRQFGKLAKTYGYDPDKFTQDLEFSFENQRGEVLLRSYIEAEKALFRWLGARGL